MDMTLQQIREARGYTRQQAANLLHASYSALYFWERGRNYPPLDMIVSMADLYAVDIGELINVIIKAQTY